MFPACQIIIVNYNLKDDTSLCVESFLKSGASLSQLIVVDNGSSDDSVSFMRKRFGSDLQILEVEGVYGYAHGLNMGGQAALSKGATWLLLMSNDTVVAPDFLHALEEAAGQNPEVHMFSPLILYYDLPDTIWFLGNYLIKGTLITRDPFHNEKKQPNYPVSLPTDFINGCSMLIHRDVFEKVGYFDSSFFMYFEEVDFCWRARRAGIKFRAAPRAQMWHKVSVTMNQDRPGTRFLRTRNQIWVYRRYSRPWQLPLMFLFSLSKGFAMGMKDVYQRRFSLLSPLMRGFWEGWTHKLPGFRI
jgi:hypothetical protein